ncbi:2444_t:CDS:1 [Gigaspora margarita]|uniref:2444_t:CDS:1 n=1 Tax=Gigaspora margarita TaxID=4874 RepID=A0ABN7WF62_GIGMA|nr:2444_t:CDS:1 [Gigaspora margarita]
MSDSDEIIWETDKINNKVEDYELLEKEADEFIFGKWNSKNHNENTIEKDIINKNENDEFLYKFDEDGYENLGLLLEKEKINSEYQLNDYLKNEDVDKLVINLYKGKYTEVDKDVFLRNFPGVFIIYKHNREKKYTDYFENVKFFIVKGSVDFEIKINNLEKN